MSFRPEVIAGSGGQWTPNSLRFATREEAEGNVAALSMRWMAVRDTRVVESTDPVNYRWVDGKLLPKYSPGDIGVCRHCRRAITYAAHDDGPIWTDDCWNDGCLTASEARSGDGADHEPI